MVNTPDAPQLCTSVRGRRKFYRRRLGLFHGTECLDHCAVWMGTQYDDDDDDDACWVEQRGPVRKRLADVRCCATDPTGVWGRGLFGNLQLRTLSGAYAEAEMAPPGRPRSLCLQASRLP